ncbi:MAG TPA: hypothetical protein VIN08_14765 [Ohtaekwangia sp.]|uniref:hypothetical protein n=1 Tax=Ohtaekwangia sp. TaxID=2066019 RepID=UPI002F9553AE
MHVFWIPFFPAGKKYVTQCNHCKNILLNGNEFQYAFPSVYKEIKQYIRTPIWTYIGVVLVVVLLINSVIGEFKKSENSKVLVQSPTKGDVYKFKTEDGQYSLLKVAEVKGDTIYVFSNNYVATQISGLDKLLTHGDSTYRTDPYPLLKSDISKMFEKRDILEVIREQ